MLDHVLRLAGFVAVVHALANALAQRLAVLGAANTGIPFRICVHFQMLRSFQM
jgi:hypothetical protein